MRLVTYLPRSSEKGRRFLDRLRRLPSETSVEVFDTQAGFIKRLRQPKDALIAILFDPSNEDLESMGGVREYLVNVSLLLVLSDQDPLTLALAHRLLPSYITYVDSDLSQLLSVIGKLLPAGGEVRKVGP